MPFSWALMQSCKNWFTKKVAQFIWTASTHFYVAVIAIDGTSSFLHLCNNLQDNTCIANWTFFSLMLLTSSPLFMLNLWNFSFINSERDLSLSLLKKMVGLSSSFGSHVKHAINTISIDTWGSSHSVILWMQLSNTFTQALISKLHLKCGISNKFSMSAISNIVSHSCVSNMISHVPSMLLVHK